MNIMKRITKRYKERDYTVRVRAGYLFNFLLVAGLVTGTLATYTIITRSVFDTLDYLAVTIIASLCLLLIYKGYYTFTAHFFGYIAFAAIMYAVFENLDGTRLGSSTAYFPGLLVFFLMFTNRFVTAIMAVLMAGSQIFYYKLVTDGGVELSAGILTDNIGALILTFVIANMIDVTLRKALKKSQYETQNSHSRHKTTLNLIHLLNDQVKKLSESTDIMYTASHTFSHNAQEQASFVEEVSATVEQVSGFVENVQGSVGVQVNSMESLMQTMESTPPPVGVGPAIPAEGQMHVALESFPVQMILAKVRGAILAGTQNPNMGPVLMMGLMTQIPTDLAQSGATLSLSDTGVSNAIYTLTAQGTGQMAPSSPAQIQGTLRLVFTGLDALLAALQAETQAGGIQAAMASGALVQSLQQAQALGDKAADKDAYTFAFALGPDGQMTLNGKPFPPAPVSLRAPQAPAPGAQVGPVE
jgi:hypothetical protein